MEKEPILRDGDGETAKSRVDKVSLVCEHERFDSAGAIQCNSGGRSGDNIHTMQVKSCLYRLPMETPCTSITDSEWTRNKPLIHR